SDVFRLRQPQREAKARFQAIGVRTATDLENAWAELKGDDAFRTSLAGAFGSGIDEKAAAARTEALVASLKGEVNLHHVRAFKNADWLDS
ncbi:MAG TPA: hypothetical protein VIG64_15170, partial [Actinomycetota bacterium]